MHTTILPVDARKIGKLQAVPNPVDLLDDFNIELDEGSEDAQHLRLAATQLRTSDIPVSFPTETVYGLGADATRSDAVRGIYSAKQRPVDNPLIVHFASLAQLRALLRSGEQRTNGHLSNGVNDDPIPAIYQPLIREFWPGPLTIILPNPKGSALAPEVTAGLTTFGARMPRHVLALALIKLADVPVAAPSANASTKPSPTAAEHVAHDLDGRIETIIDGGDCDVGVESTVVDGLSDPPLVLRPGGISIEQLRSCPGWLNTQIGYKNAAESEFQPKAPGMKYRHYSPKARVILFESGQVPPSAKTLLQYSKSGGKIGVVCTRTWAFAEDGEGRPIVAKTQQELALELSTIGHTTIQSSGFAGLLQAMDAAKEPRKALQQRCVQCEGSQVELMAIPLGPDTATIAKGLFASLRELDLQNVDAIIVEGIDDGDGGTSAAVMNRLRKAAEVRVSG